MDDIDNPAPPSEKSTAGDRQAELDALIASARSVVQARRKPWERALLPVAVIILLAIIGFGAYWQFFHGKASPAHKAQSSAQSAANKLSSNTSQARPNVPTQPDTSTNFNLSFNYPDGWTVVDNGSGPLTVTSPGMQLTSANGQTVTGQATMTIQKQGQIPASFSAGPAIAVLNSQKITYAQPAQGQASQSYLSFVQYSSTTTKGGLDAIYLTGNDGYQKDQAIPASDIAGVDPLVVVAFTKCGNTACTSNLTPLTIASISWNKSPLQASIMTMLTSLAFQ